MNTERLRQLLHYTPATGVFTWNETRGPAKRGSVAGAHCNKGYLVIGVEGKVYKAHRLAWLYMTGEWPADQVDHRNTIKDDNRWANLRGASNQQNCCNRARANRTGVQNVGRTKGGRFVARVQSDGVRIHIGTFDTIAEAAKAATEHRQQAHGAFARNE